MCLTDCWISFFNVGRSISSQRILCLEMHSFDARGDRRQVAACRTGQESRWAQSQYAPPVFTGSTFQRSINVVQMFATVQSTHDPALVVSMDFLE
jgi:hypothetical protein